MWNSISHKINAPAFSIQLVKCLKGMRQLIGSSPPVSASSQRIPFLHQTVSGKVRSSGQLSGGPEASVVPWRTCLFCEQWNTLLNKQQNRKKKSISWGIREGLGRVADPTDSIFLGGGAEIDQEEFQLYLLELLQWQTYLNVSCMTK